MKSSVIFIVAIILIAIKIVPVILQINIKAIQSRSNSISIINATIKGTEFMRNKKLDSRKMKNNKSFI